MVVLTDRREFEAKLIGTDPATDIAVLKIEAEDLIQIPQGNSDNVFVGDFVIAIGIRLVWGRQSPLELFQPLAARRLELVYWKTSSRPMRQLIPAIRVGH